jgi:hypothetical protein
LQLIWLLMLILGLDPQIPFRLAEKRRMSWGFGVCMSERSEFTPRQLIRASQGTHIEFYMGKYAGVVSFGSFSLDKQRKGTRA